MDKYLNEYITVTYDDGNEKIAEGKNRGRSKEKNNKSRKWERKMKSNESKHSPPFNYFELAFASFFRKN